MTQGLENITHMDTKGKSGMFSLNTGGRNREDYQKVFSTDIETKTRNNRCTLQLP